jgi:tetratricopeptide (TPR) repeat protein
MKKDLRLAKKREECPLRNEIEFVSYCHCNLSEAEQTKMDKHIKNCGDCRERLTLVLNVLLMESLPEESDSDAKFFDSAMWHNWKEEAAYSHARSIRNRFSYNRATILKVAAMLVLALIPLIVTYGLIIKPIYEPRPDNRLISRSIYRELGTELSATTDAFEEAEAILKENPQQEEALLKRAASLEKLMLFEDAKKDYIRLLEVNGARGSRAEVEKRLRAIDELLSSSKPVSPSRYELLDQEIDKYLSALKVGDRSGAKTAIKNAEAIALEMFEKTGERFGLDLVSYYRVLPAGYIEPLLEARRLRNEVTKTKSFEGFTKALENAIKAKNVFHRFASDCDVEQVDIVVVKYLIKVGSLYDAENLIEENIQSSSSRKHLFSHAQFLHKQGVYLSDNSKFNDAIKALKEAVELAGPLDVPQFILLPSLILTNIYHVTNENAKAFKEAHRALQSAQATNQKDVYWQLLQVLGISAYNLGYSSLTDVCLNRLITLAREQKHYSYLAMTHAFLGIVRAEQARYQESDNNFAIAMQSLQQIEDKKSRLWFEFNVNGYYARSQMLASNVNKAIELYTRTLAIAEESNVQQKLALSQLHQGLGECLITRGDLKWAESELALATSLDKEARAQFEENNSLLSFATTRKSPAEQLQMLKQLN